MSLMKASQLRTLSAQELEQKKSQLQVRLHELRQKKVVGQLEKPDEFATARRQIAQINTLLREKKNGK